MSAVESLLARCIEERRNLPPEIEEGNVEYKVRGLLAVACRALTKALPPGSSK